MKNKKIFFFVSTVAIILAVITTIILANFEPSPSNVAGTYETDDGTKIFLSENRIVSNSESEYGHWYIEGKSLILSFKMPKPSDTEFSDYYEETSQSGLYRNREGADADEYRHLSGVNIYYNNTLEKLNKDIYLIQIPRYITIPLSDISTNQNLTVEYIGGVKISNFGEANFLFLDNEERTKHVWTKID